MSDTNASPAAPAVAATAAPGADAAALAAAASAAAAPAVDDSASIGEAPVASDEVASSDAAAYEPTGDVGLDLALEFIGARGIKPSDPAILAAEKGDFSLIEAKLAAMGDKAKGYEKMVALAKRAFDDTKAAADAKAAEGAKLIHETVGGKDNWLAIKTWAATNAEPAEKASINAALAQGGLVAKITAQWLLSKFNSAAGTTVQPAAVTTAASSGKPAPMQHLTRQAFIAEAETLRQKIGYGFESSKEYAALRSRRAASARAGH